MLEDFLFGRGKKDPYESSPEYLLLKTQHTLLLRQMGCYLPEELTTEIMQSYFEQMFEGSECDRYHALYCWTEGILKNPSVPMSQGYPETLDEALEVLMSIIHKSEGRLPYGVVDSIANLFSGSAHRNAARNLAELVCQDSLEQPLRMRAYFALWRVTKKSVDIQAYLSSGMLLELMEETNGNAERDRADMEHFKFAIRSLYDDIDVGFDTYVRWDWVKSFLN